MVFTRPQPQSTQLVGFDGDWPASRGEADSPSSPVTPEPSKSKRMLSEAGRKAISEATTKRWAAKKAAPAVAKKAAAQKAPVKTAKKAAKAPKATEAAQ